MGIINTIQASHPDLYNLVEPFSDFWDEVLGANIFCIALAVFCVGYPIYYLLDQSNQKIKQKANSQQETTSSRPQHSTNAKLKPSTSTRPQTKLNKALFVVYFISFIPYLFIVYSVTFGLEFCIFSNCSISYGFEGAILALIVGTILPVYPLVLIFQIIFTVKKHQSFSSRQELAAKLIVIFLLIFTLVPSVTYLFLDK